MAVTLESTKRHLRIDDFDNTENDHLNLLIAAATKHVGDLTGINNDENAPATYDLAVQLLIANWYANREIVKEGSVAQVPYGFAALLQNLRPVEGLI